MLNEEVDFAQTLITLDHRRVPLPRSGLPAVLSIRASDFPSDPGVLYTEQEMAPLNVCIVSVANAKHNDMTDLGPDWLKVAISNMLLSFILGQCNVVTKA